MPNNSKTNWQCTVCKRPNRSVPPATTCTSSTGTVSSLPVPLSVPSTSNIQIDSASESDDDVEITKETKGEIDKQSSLANLTDSDYQTILNPIGWLNCDIIQEAQALLHEVNPSIKGFQRPTLGPVRNFDVVTSEFVQLLHTGSDHWVCISSIGCVPGDVNLYDSLYHDAISQEVEEQADDLLGGSLFALNYVPVQQQTYGADCGVMAIAFA